MILWVDGDSCPRPAMDVVLGFHKKRKLQLVVIADRNLPGVEEQGASMIVLPHGSGEVDDKIAEDANPGDLVLTRDFLLGIRMMELGVKVINDRGKLWKLSELKSRAVDAELMKALKDGGITNKSTNRYSSDDKRLFASSLDRIIALQGSV